MSVNLTPNQALELWQKAVVEGVKREAPNLSARK